MATGSTAILQLRCAGIFVGLPALFFITGVILAYPWFFVPVLVVVCALLANRAARRRRTIAARADWEHSAMMARYAQQPPPPTGFEPDLMRQAWQPEVWSTQQPPAPPIPAVRPQRPAPWHVVTQWPTRQFNQGGPR